ncbi:hypothetical protein C2E23DRAFT_722276, partial [Lenzites betulinus]
RETSKSKFFPDTVATVRQVRGFDPQESRCCDVGNFCLDLNATPGTPWNVSATAVFVDDFIQVRLYTCTNRAKITKMFVTHYRTLQRQFKKYGMIAPSAPTATGSTAGVAGLAGAAEAMPLFQRRYRIALRYPHTRPHVRLLQQLGTEGMSSDEEDKDSPYTRYRILRKPWRAPAVTTFLRVLDALHRRWRSRHGQGNQRGAPPRLRYMGTDVSNLSRPVRGLPINFYDANWLAARTDVQRADLQPVDTPHALHHSGEILT